MKRKKIFSILLTLILSSNILVGCDLNGFQSNNGGDARVTLWSPPATQKIMRDKEYAEKDAAALVYQMSKNETEGAQVIITPDRDYTVNEFTVSTSDLKGPDGAIISKDSIEVYLQKYVRIDKQINNNQAYGTGYQPDPLLPFDVAEEYGENTVVGKNQGIYVTVKTQKDTTAGTYTGNFNINIDGTSYSVPMMVEVWDFAISDESHTKTLFDIWTSYMMDFDLDASDEMYNAYAEALLDYRLSPAKLSIPTERTRTLTDYIDAFIEYSIEATEDVRISAYQMPVAYFEGITDEKKQNRIALFKEMAYASTEEVFLFDKMVIWFATMIDEPQFSESKHALVNPVIESVTASEEEAIAQLENEGFFDSIDSAFAERIKEAIRNIPLLLTGPYDETYIDGELTYCPLFDQFNSEEKRAVYADQQEKNGSLWWYGCTGPCFPNPTYHIDDHLLAARVLSWMQYDYNIDGNLYWCVNQFDKYQPLESVWEAVKPDNMNGDGILFYPGSDYGIYGPVGSLRLEAIRDGLEDYEYLYQLEQETKSLSEYYGEPIEARKMLRPLFDRMYTNTHYDTDNYNFFAVRSEIADLMSSCKGEEKFLLKELSYSGEMATIKFNVASGYEVKVNGETLTGVSQGQGKTYNATIKLDKSENLFKIVTKKGEQTTEFTVDAGKETRILTTFDNAVVKESVKGNGNTISVNQMDASAWGENTSAVKVEVVSTFDPKNPLATLTYTPEVSIDLTQLSCNVADLATIRLRVYNDTGMDITVRAVLLTKYGEENFWYKDSLVLKQGWNTISFEGLDKIHPNKLKDIAKFVIQFQNTVNDEHKEAMPKQTLYFDELLVSYVGKEGK